MNKSKAYFCAAVMACSIISSRADTTLTNTFSVGSPSGDIPDGNLVGISDSQVLDFSSTPNFSQITDLQVTLNITGTSPSAGFNGDLFAYLVHDNTTVVLLNRVGSTAANPAGSPGQGMSVTLSDSAAANIHTGIPSGTAQLTGTWQPDGRTTYPTLTLDTDTPTTSLSMFDNADPNGTWTLFLADVDFGDKSTLVSWGLIITADVPEPSVMALMVVGGLLGGAGMLRRRWQS